MATAPNFSDLTPFEREFEELRERFPKATTRFTAGQTLISLGSARLPNGWNKEMTDVHFFVPAGYPHANPDCFYVDADVRLANGTLPANAQLQQLGDIGQALWFSYHLSRPWKPGRDRLLTWVATIAARLAEAR